MQSTDQYTQEEQDLLLRVAVASIKHGLTNGTPVNVIVDSYPARIQRKRACFVTLEIDDRLRGCIGTLEAHRSLVEDVAQNAFASAFRDPRFPTLNRTEYSALTVSISVLSESEPMVFRSEHDLLEQIRPNIDGLILSDGYRRGTFLPSVWESLPDAKVFLQQLKIKAGIRADEWSDRFKVDRYTTFSFHRSVTEIEG